MAHAVKTNPQIHTIHELVCPNSSAGVAQAKSVEIRCRGLIKAHAAFGRGRQAHALRLLSSPYPCLAAFVRLMSLW